MSIPPIRVVYGSVLLVLVVSLSIAGVHHLSLDVSLLLIELGVFLALIALGLYLWYTRTMPLCHITFVRLRHSEYIATTEYYRRTLYSEQRLAKAIARAQRDLYVISVTHRENGKEVYIPIRASTATFTQPTQPPQVCPTCNTLAWEWTGKQYVCLTCQAAQDASSKK